MFLAFSASVEELNTSSPFNVLVNQASTQTVDYMYITFARVRRYQLISSRRQRSGANLSVSYIDCIMYMPQYSFTRHSHSLMHTSRRRSDSKLIGDDSDDMVS